MQIEILAPAGNEDSFLAAINAGANAIYLGLKEFSARGSAENFSLDNLDFYLKKAHFFGVKVYIAVNTLIKNSELNDFFETILKAYRLGADAFIMQDIFLGKVIKEKIPDICLHLSTQAGVCNVLGAKLAKSYGFSRVILARETQKEDIEQIAKIIETEIFVHGALCSSFSGHCYLSSFVGGMSGNRGYCKQPCRKFYTYSGKGFKPFSGYNLSLSDLCLKDEVFDLEKIGVASFKIEGRMRSPEYVYQAVTVFKEALQGNYDEKEFALLRRGFNRGHFTKGYYLPKSRDIISSKIQGNIGDFIGNVFKVENGVAKIKTREKFIAGDGFKCLADGKEIDGGSFLSQNGDVLSVDLKKAKIGNEVYITKDKKLSDYVKELSVSKKVDIELYFRQKEKAKVVISFDNKRLTVYSDDIFEISEKKPLSKDELIDCFNKLDGLPFNLSLSILVLENIFAPKSLLNAFRRKCFNEVYEFSHNEIVKPRNKAILPDACFLKKKTEIISHINNDKNIVVISDFRKNCFDNFVVVYKPQNYKDSSEIQNFLSKCKSEKYLYLPPFACGKDIEIFTKAVNGFDGMYAEGCYGLQLGCELGLKIIAGTGFNIFNDVDISVIDEYPFIKGICYSKELSNREISMFDHKDGYRLALGDIQVMDLIYCPFGFSCESCNRGSLYSLKDEQGREFKVRRYKVSSCRFEVYNPFKLVSERGGGELYDFSLATDSEIERLLKAENLSDRKAVYGEGRYTGGNLTKGVK